LRPGAGRSERKSARIGANSTRPPGASRSNPASAASVTSCPRPASRPASAAKGSTSPVLPAASTITAAIPDANDPRAVRHKPAAAAARPKQRSGIRSSSGGGISAAKSVAGDWVRGYPGLQHRRAPRCPMSSHLATSTRKMSNSKNGSLDADSIMPPTPVQVITAITDARAGLASFARARMDSSSSSGPGQGMDRTAGSRRRS
jgi:hypothetical protein